MSLVMTGGTQWDRRELLGRLDRGQWAAVTEAPDAGQAIEVLSQLEPAVCLLAGKMRGGTLAAIMRIKAASPGTRLAVMLDPAGEDADLRAIRAGADGFLSREITAEGLAAALRALADGDALIPRELAARVVSELRTEAPTANAHRTSSRLASFLLYPPRFSRHLWRRRRARMPLRIAWRSARERMYDYH